jgi:histidine triad (HIT) family protein
MSDCIFCKLASGQIPTNVIYEDENAFAFLDMNPINEGHTLVIPKKHESDFHKLDENTYLSVMRAVKKISIQVENVFNPKKVGLIVAGFDVPHAHVHVVPMYEYHDITSQKLLDTKRVKPSADELTAVAEKLRL